MHKGRLEAFSDGVIAIIITIMVLELKAPHGTELSDLRPLLPAYLAYVLSFLYVAIYWTNHHHLFQAVTHVNGRILWANIHLLFWLSLTPFVTAWAGENHFASLPVALYGTNLILCAIAYTILVRTLIHHHGRDSVIAKAVGNDFKGRVSIAFYAAAIAAAFWVPAISCALYALVAVIWIVPDKRIEKRVT